MSKPSRRVTPRSRVEELKALRTSHKKLRPVPSKTSKGVSMISTLSNILNSSESTMHNTTLVVNKPAVPLIPITKLSTARAAWLKQALSTTAGSLNSSRKVQPASSGRSRIVPKPPSKEKPKEGPRRNTVYLTPQQQFERLETPVTAEAALKQFRDKLTRYEQTEILAYDHVYYLGFNAPKAEAEEGLNFGFDDENGDYRLFKHEHVAFRFEILKLLGKGSFGQVCECIDHKTKQRVALKVIKNHKKFKYQAGVEIKVLKALKEQDPDDHHNVIKLKRAFEFRKHVWIVFELLDTNLYDLLKANDFKGFSLKLVRRFAVQILVGLCFIKRLNIIHCDLKPENILLKQAKKSGIKIIDFGSACFQFEKVYTYIQSRFYRAPEIILGIPYTPAIDMWSFGCILTELYSGDALLQGESEAEQLNLIMELRGLPPRKVFEAATRKKLFFKPNGLPRQLSEGQHYTPGSKPLADRLKIKDAAFLDLVDQCLDWDPETRITPEEALSHPWITEILTQRHSRRKPRESKKALAT